MASNVFPMLSSSPPPIDDCPDDDDDDDEFGNFTSANIPFDSSFDSPVAGEKFKSFKPGDNGINDANFSNEIHKFNSFSNSDSPSPQEFVPNFNDESEYCKNGFTPIKTENCKISERDLDISSNEDSVCHNKIDITSHKPVSLKSESVLSSSNNCEPLTFESCDSQQNTTFKNSVINKSDKKLEDIAHEPNSLEGSSVCDSTEDIVEKLSHKFCDDEGRTSVTCDEPKAFISDPVTDSKFSKDTSDLEKNSSSDGNFLSADKFDCDFKSESSENDPEEYGDFEQSNNLFASNDTFSSTVKLPDDTFPIMSNTDIADKISKSNVDCQSASESDQELPENEFDEFQSCGEKLTVIESTESVSKSNDEFDDFQDFQYSSVSNVEADDFADFQDFAADASSNADDFADFSAVPFDSNKPSENSEPNEFADFEEASFDTSAENSFQVSSAGQKSTDPLSTVINAIFPLPDSVNDSDTSDETSPQILEQTNKSRRLWEKLHEVEQTPGLRFQWGVSHSFQQLLRSVNVDYHSILRTSSVPIFASGLSLLEPVKGLSSSANHESEDRNQIPKDPIPPVEFDWNSSGLINPLDSGQAASTLMDLSFLSSVETDTNATCNDHSFENELLKPSPAILCPENSSKTQILEQLLSKNVSSLPNSKITHRPSDLSEEAVRVLDQLPDLSFMQAKVLMFPISSKT